MVLVDPLAGCRGWLFVWLLVAAGAVGCGPRGPIGPATDSPEPPDGFLDAGTADDSGLCGVDLDASCPNDLPDDCAQGSPSYELEIAPTIAARCSVCHAPTGVQTTKLFGTYAEAYNLRGQMLFQIYACRMPPACATPLSQEAREKILQWFVCGAPDDSDARVAADGPAE